MQRFFLETGTPAVMEGAASEVADVPIQRKRSLGRAHHFRPTYPWRTWGTRRLPLTPLGHTPSLRDSSILCSLLSEECRGLPALHPDSRATR
jgi:hypothetical protein